jgi:Zn-dependent protease with chaperone function
MEKIMKDQHIVIENYLKKLNEYGSIVFSSALLVRFIMEILFRIAIKVNTRKIETDLSKKVSEITGKKYTVISIKDESPNAFVFTVFKQNIYVTTGLIKLLPNERELISILLHEAGHMINHDVIQGRLSQDGSLWFFNAIFIALDIKILKLRVPEALFGSMIMAVIIIGFLSHWWWKIGRKQETRADVYTVQYGYGKDLINALKKFEKYIEKELKRLEKDDPEIRQRYEEAKQYDVHPEIKDRIKKLLEEIDLWKAIFSKNLGKIKQIVYKIMLGKEDLKSEVSKEK